MPKMHFRKITITRFWQGGSPQQQGSAWLTLHMVFSLCSWGGRTEKKARRSLTPATFKWPWPTESLAWPRVSIMTHRVSTLTHRISTLTTKSPSWLTESPPWLTVSILTQRISILTHRVSTMTQSLHHDPQNLHHDPQSLPPAVPGARGTIQVESFCYWMAASEQGESAQVEDLSSCKSFALYCVTLSKFTQVQTSLLYWDHDDATLHSIPPLNGYYGPIRPLHLGETRTNITKNELQK